MARILRFMGVVGLNMTYFSLDITFFSVSRDGLFDRDPNWSELGAALPLSESRKPPDPDLSLQLQPDQPWHRNSGDFETWDLHALAAYLTREPAAFPSLRSVGFELTLFECVDNEELAEILLPELSALKDAGLLRVFCDEMTQESRTIFGIEPLPVREEW
ncbi:hypothetical protein V8D89_006309 [Ganoderma adspersum]